MDDVGAWLANLGLEQYAATFRANGIDRRALPLLTDRDLDSLGVALGHRRVLLAAIAGETAGREPMPPTKAGEPERRPITVMFCDLVGSTSLSAELDVEDYRDLIRGYQDICAGIVARYDGYLARFMGDGALVYFGYPHAHEDDARRTVRAALDVLAAVSALQADGNRLAVRIGIATGEVVVGDLIGEGAAEELTALGVTPNLAARLQSHAAPGQILVSDATRQRLRDAFALADLGPLSLKGMAEPVRAWRIEGLRSPAAGPAVRTPFVGRRHDLARLEAAWQQARTGRLEVLHLTGPPGIGKSRLVDEFAAGVADGETLTWGCSALDHNTPFHPLPPDLVPAPGPGETVGEAQRQKLFDAVVRALGERAGNRPLLLVVEDAHWLDPTTAALLEMVRRRLAGSPILVLVVSRPGEVAARLQERLGGSLLELEGLDEFEAAALAETIADKPLTAEARRDIVSRAGGLPLFVEELTRIVAADEAAAVPVTLQESLLARLDSLGPAKRIVQLASVFGQSFARDDLARLAELEDVEIGPALNRLLAEGVLIETDGRLAFRHALVHDVAYETLLRSTRRRIHGEIADRLIADAGAVAPEIIARHLAGADRLVEAARYWHEAGRRSAQLWAHAEAAGYFESGLRHAGSINDPAWELPARLNLVESLRILDRYDEALDQLDRAEALAGRIGSDTDWLRLHLLRGNILFPLGDADRCVAANEAALTVARRLADPEAEARALSGIGDARFAGRRLASAEQAFDACVRLAEANGLNRVIVANVPLRGHMRLYLGRLAEARRDSAQGLHMALSLGDRRAEYVARGSCLGKVLLEAGEWMAADAAFAEAGRLAGDLGAHRNKALNLLFRGQLALNRRDRTAGLAMGREAAMIARAAGPQFCLPLALGVVARGEQSAAAARAALDEAEAMIARGCLAHNPLWFYRDAGLAAAGHGWWSEMRRYARAMRTAFAAEPLVWVDLMADGLEALAGWLEAGEREALEATANRAHRLGYHGWTDLLRSFADARP